MIVGIVLGLLQFVAAVPWLLALTWQPAPPRTPGHLHSGPVRRWRPEQVLGAGLGIALVAGLLLGYVIGSNRNRELLESYGKTYGAILQLQLYADVFALVFALALWLWPKGGAVARAAFRQGYRQPMFWLLLGLAGGMLILSPFVPYFTFGEDYIMVKELGFDTIMLAASALGVLAAAMSITEEIEGRTAVTLMSKPVSRRQFLLGKFLGIFLCALLLILGAGWLFDLVLLYKRWFERMEPLPLAPATAAWINGLTVSLESRNFLRGIVQWGRHTSEVVPGLVMAASLVMILVAVAVSLATRLPMIVNLVTCLVVYVLANLMPVLVLSTRPVEGSKAGPVQKLLYFTAQLFDTLLPGLELFRVRPTLVDDIALPMGEYVRHVAAVSVYGLLFTSVILLAGLVLFEDRDLA